MSVPPGGPAPPPSDRPVSADGPPAGPTGGQPARTLDIAALQRQLRQFAAQRHWQRFHTPKNLATALVVEAAELAEIFQWLTPEESCAAGADPRQAERIGDEIADVLLYLLQIADHTGVDVAAAVERKLAKNALKHPPP